MRTRKRLLMYFITSSMKRWPIGVLSPLLVVCLSCAHGESRLTGRGTAFDGESKLAGSWALIEATMPKGSEGFAGAPPDFPYLVFREDGSIYSFLLMNFAQGTPFDRLRKKGDRVTDLKTGKPTYIEVEDCRYTADSSELLLLFENPQEEQNYRISFKAEVQPDGELSFRQAWLLEGQEHHVMTARLKRLDDDWPWAARGLMWETPGHEAGASCVAMSPDGRFILAAGGFQHVIRLLDARNGKEVRRFGGHLRKITSVAFSADGRLAVSGSSRSTIHEVDEYSLRIWEVGAGRELHKIKSFEMISSVCFSPDGRSVLSAGMKARDATRAQLPAGQLWSVETGELQQEYARPGSSGTRSQFSFSPDGRFVLSSVGNMCLVDASTAEEVRCFEGVFTGEQRVCFFRDGTRVLTTGMVRSRSPVKVEALVREWDVATGQILRSVKCENRTSPRALYLPDGKRIIFARGYYDMHVLDLETEEVVQRFDSRPKSIGDLAISGDGCLVVTGHGDGSVRLWKLSAEE